MSGSGLTRHHPKPKLNCREVPLDQGILRSIERGNSSGMELSQLACDYSVAIEFVQPQIKHEHSMEVQFRALKLYIHTIASQTGENFLTAVTIICHRQSTSKLIKSPPLEDYQRSCSSDTDPCQTECSSRPSHEPSIDYCAECPDIELAPSSGYKESHQKLLDNSPYIPSISTSTFPYNF